MEQIDAFEDMKKMPEFDSEKQRLTLESAIRELQVRTRALKKLLKQLNGIEDKKNDILKTCMDLAHD